MSKKPKVLIWDIETSHNLLLGFDLLNDTSVPYQNIIIERHLFCISYKWLGEKKVHTISILDNKKRFNNDIHDDYFVVSEFRKVLEEADAQVFHYGTKFDLPMLNARLAFHGLNPIPKIVTIDTKFVASRNFRFNSNRLDYLARFLGYKMGKMPNPPDLWNKCFAGDKKSLEHMGKYNKKDVEINEFIFNRLSPFIKNNPLNRNQFTGDVVCPNCGSSKLQWRGYTRTRVNKHRRFQCNDCGAWGSDRKADKGGYTPKVQ